MRARARTHTHTHTYIHTYIHTYTYDSMAFSSSKNWADMEEDEEPFEGNRINDEEDILASSGGALKELPTEEIVHDPKSGIYTKTTYEIDGEGNKVRKVQRYRKLLFERKIFDVATRRRREWKKFGMSAGVANGEFESCTNKSKDPIYMEDPNKRSAADDEAKNNELTAKLKAAVQKRSLARLGGETREEPDSDNAAAISGSAKAGGSYVPPHLRGGGALEQRSSGSSFYEEDGYKLKVSNLSEETREAHLETLFGSFGRVRYVRIAKDQRTGLSRGFAFITFFNQRDGEKAKEALDGYGYDHLILKVEKARPRERRDDSGGGGVNRRFMSGYGKALPQGMGPSK